MKASNPLAKTVQFDIVLYDLSLVGSFPCPLCKRIDITLLIALEEEVLKWVNKLDNWAWKSLIPTGPAFK